MSAFPSVRRARRDSAADLGEDDLQRCIALHQTQWIIAKKSAVMSESGEQRSRPLVSPIWCEADSLGQWYRYALRIANLHESIYLEL